jgi:small subunit ribosomal protein S4e
MVRLHVLSALSCAALVTAHTARRNTHADDGAKIFFFFFFFFDDEKKSRFSFCFFLSHTRRSQARGPKLHLKRLNAPSHWMLSKLGGNYAPRPSPGPHKLRECLPLTVLLRNRLKYALNGSEVVKILKQRLVSVDGRVRADPGFPAGFMDVVQIQKTNDTFRLLYDVKGRFAVHRIVAAEAKFKLCRVRRLIIGDTAIPYLTTHDGRIIRFPDPRIKVNDTVKIALETGKIVDHVRFEIGNLAMIVGGRNLGRVGLVQHVEKHDGSFTIVQVKDAAGNTFATRLTNVFIIGKGTKSLVSLPKVSSLSVSVAPPPPFFFFAHSFLFPQRKGVRKSIIEERADRLAKSKHTAVKKNVKAKTAAKK